MTGERGQISNLFTRLSNAATVNALYGGSDCFERGDQDTRCHHSCSVNTIRMSVHELNMLKANFAVLI